MRNISYILVFFVLSLASCDNWLDVRPEKTVSEDDLFEQESGYKQLLTGAYISMAQECLYGQDLLVGIPDVLAQYWKIEVSSQVYYDFAQYDYTTQLAEEKLSSIWSAFYKTIANLNILLGHLDELNGDEWGDYKLVRGEALGLRGFLHLDLLRLFGPVINEAGLEELSIPYRTQFDNQIVRRMKVRDVFSLIEKDLLAAYENLKEDPILTNGRENHTINTNHDMAYNFRSIRMNYYAVAASLARFYLLKGDKTKAYQYAKEVIDAKNVFQLLLRSDMVQEIGKRDLMFEREIIFGLYEKNLDSKLCLFMGYGKGSEVGGHAVNMKVDAEWQNEVYNQSGKVEDYRYANWFKELTGGLTLYKYYRNLEKDGQTPYQPLLPVIRLSEMYYIAAEALLGIDNPGAWALLNQVRKSRNIGDLDESLKEDTGKLLEQLLVEQRKEYWGEGKLFYTYKRLFMDIPKLHGKVEATKAVFELPLPDDEYEFGNN